MASQNILNTLTANDKAFDLINWEKLTRKNLGDESLENELKPRIEKIEDLRNIIKKYANTVYDSYVSNMATLIKQIADAMSAQANLGNPEYMSQKEQFLRQIDTHLEQSKQWLPYFITEAVQERGFLVDEGIKQEYSNAIEKLKSETAATLAHIKGESERSIQGAKQLADEIEARARRTASKISIKEAQDQFTTASNDLKEKVKLWAWLVAVSLACLIGIPIIFMYWLPLPLDSPNSKDISWVIPLYHSILRIFILTAIASISAFCIRVFRAHLHMKLLNEHRVRIANSLESFVNSALEPQQRDLILTKLTEAIVDFGDSGIIKSDRDETGCSSLSAEFMGRILSALSSKKT